MPYSSCNSVYAGPVNLAVSSSTLKMDLCRTARHDLSRRGNNWLFPNESIVALGGAS